MPRPEAQFAHPLIGIRCCRVRHTRYRVSRTHSFNSIKIHIILNIISIASDHTQSFLDF